MIVAGELKKLQDKQALDTLFVGMRDQRRSSKLPLPLTRFAREDMPPVHFVTLDPSGRGHFERFPRAAM